jgi:hypothetical protein
MDLDQASALIAVEVAYAKPDQQVIVQLNLPEGSTVAQAISKSGLLQQFPELDVQSANVGVFGKVCALNQLIKQADRIEIYRPLLNDPKDARRQRAAKR